MATPEAAGSIDLSGPRPRPMCVSGYVGAAFDDVVGALAGPEGRDVLAASLAAGFGLDADQLTIDLRPVDSFAGGDARFAVSWRARSTDGRESAGDATVSALVVQSGNDAVTELLIRLVVDDAASARVAPAIHRCIDELTAHLARTDAS